MCAIDNHSVVQAANCIVELAAHKRLNFAQHVVADFAATRYRYTTRVERNQQPRGRDIVISRQVATTAAEQTVIAGATAQGVIPLAAFQQIVPSAATQ